MKSSPSAPVAEVSIDDIRHLIEQAQQRPITREEGERIFQVALSYFRVTELIADKEATLAKLRKLLFGVGSEKTARVVGKTGPTADGQPEPPAPVTSETANQPSGNRGSKPRAPGHGRNGAAEYTGASKTRIELESSRPGDCCPNCPGKLYRLAEPAVLVRVTGGAPLQGHVWELERVRCNLCGDVITAKAPEGVGNRKYDAGAGSMIALLRYGSGLPFNRLERLQAGFGIPLPASTQWEIVASCAKTIEPAFTELVRQAAQGEVLHNDDTGMEILQLRAELRDRPPDEDDGRTGIFTTGIVARVAEARKIALFFTGRQHAGENLADLLQQRASESPPPIQMCDGLDRNLPKQFEIVLGNCLAHGRRQFVDAYEAFPAECRHVLEALRVVYRNDAIAKSMTPTERLYFHQRESGPVMDDLKGWLQAQLAERKVEPNSRLGKAITYLLKRWEPLTLFLRRTGAPLDNNLCEQALKRAIVHRKNSLFYKTENGARVGDLFMSLIHTAELCGANPFDYLVELQNHAEELRRDPASWMPWNYRPVVAVDADPG